METTRATLYRGILQALAYADIFDYPLTLPELHRYTVGVSVPLTAVAQAVAPGSPLARYVEHRDEFITLKGRGHLVAVRRRREQWAHRLWPKAIAYGRRIAAMPFVRMVAVTGALAVNNVEADDDIDYLVVTEPGRVWLCRALVIALVRWAARRGDVLCPNYFLATPALALSEQDLFTAHEVAQMVPVTGQKVYWKMRHLNAWTTRFLPNAVGPPRWVPDGYFSPWGQWLAECVLRTPIGAYLERWERERKVRKFTPRSASAREVCFAPDRCKGHFDQHGRHTLQAFQRRWQELQEALADLGVEVVTGVNAES